MAAPFAPASSIPSSYEVPGVYFEIRASGAGAATSAPSKRALLWGHKTASGTGQYNSPIRCPGLQQALLYAGQGSDAARAFQAFTAQAGNGSADVYLMLVPDPSTTGAQATRTLIVAGTPTLAGSVDIWICGYLLSVRISLSDTATTIGAAIRDAINAIADLPVTASASTGTVTLTYRHFGYVGNDIPIIVSQTDASGITFSPGTVTFASNNPSGAGTATLSIGGTTISAALAGSETATQAAVKLKNAINAGSYPVSATEDGAGVITLYYVPGRVVNKVSASIVTTTGITATVACGTVVSNNSANRPTLTTALANLANQDGGFRTWLSTWNDATTVGTLATNIESAAGPITQREQFLFVGSTDGIVTAGALPSATTPALTGLWRDTVLVQPDSPQQAYEIAARGAAMVAIEDYAPRNYDGAELRTDPAQRVPFLLPHPAVRIAPGSDDVQMALHTYGLTPVCVTADGRQVIAKGRTTWQTDAGPFRDWGGGQHVGFLRLRFVAVGSALIAGKNIRRNGPAHSPNVITVESIRDALIAEAARLDAIDLYDGAETFKSAFQFSFDPNLSDRVNGYVPLAVIRSLHQLTLVGDPQ